MNLGSLTWRDSVLRRIHDANALADKHATAKRARQLAALRGRFMMSQWLLSLPEPSRRRLGNGILCALGFGVLIALWGTLVRIHEGMDTGREQVRASGQRIARELDQELAVYVSNLHGMKYLAERFMQGRARGTGNPIARLVPVPSQAGYQSVLPPEMGDLSTLGRITGSGPVPGLHDSVADEMVMAIGLTPLMRAIKERSPDVAWVQYASARKFMFIFPHKGSEGFFFQPGLLQRDYFNRARPEVNPQRHIFWSEPYQDAAGLGTIVTVTQPLDRDNEFVGSVSIDFKLQGLARYLEGVPIPKTHVHLVSKAGAPLAAASSETDDSAVLPHEQIHIPLHNAPWTLELNINQGELLQASLRARMWHVTAWLLAGLAYVSVLLLTRSYRRARDLSISDGLTGLFNRRHFDTVARHQFELARRNHIVLGLAILDIDFFKKYNDTYGHQKGDETLKAVAQAVQGALRRGTDQVFRVGGEEFAILLSLRHASEMEPLMNHVNQAVRDLQWPHSAHAAGHITVSVGATVVDSAHWINVESAYRQADQWLYEAKQTGRDRSVVKLLSDMQATNPWAPRGTPG